MIIEALLGEEHRRQKSLALTFIVTAALILTGCVPVEHPIVPTKLPQKSEEAGGKGTERQPMIIFKIGKVLDDTGLRTLPPGSQLPLIWNKNVRSLGPFIESFPTFQDVFGIWNKANSKVYTQYYTDQRGIPRVSIRMSRLIHQQTIFHESVDFTEFARVGCTDNKGVTKFVFEHSPSGFFPVFPPPLNAYGGSDPVVFSDGVRDCPTKIDTIDLRSGSSRRGEDSQFAGLSGLSIGATIAIGNQIYSAQRIIPDMKIVQTIEPNQPVSSWRRIAPKGPKPVAI